MLRASRCASAMIAVLLVLGCDDSPKPTINSVNASSREAVAQFTAARQAPSSDSAKRAQELLQRCDRSIQELQPTTLPTDAQAWNETMEQIGQARRLSKLVEEDQLLRERTSSLKARAYRGARNVTVSAALKSLAFAAAQHSPSTQPTSAQRLAESCAQAATGITAFCDEGLPGISTTRPVDPVAASRLSAMAADPPDRIALLMGIGWTFTGQSTLALVETDLARSHGTLTSDELVVLSVLRSMALSIDGLPHLAAEEMQKACSMSPQASMLNGEVTLGTLHLLLGLEHLQNGEYVPADQEFALALRAWPSNPAAVFVTGERLSAAGEYEPAAQSLELAAAGTNQQWLAAMIAQRARSIRDEKGEAKPLLGDPVFLAKLLLNSLAEQGKQQAAQCIEALTQAAVALTKPGQTTESAGE